MDQKFLFQSKILKFVLWGIGIAILMLLAFKGGEFVGFRKAEFSYHWGENYYRSFAGPRGESPGDLRGRDFLSAHGILGSIIKIASSTLIIQDRDGTEKTVLLSDETVVRRFRDEISPSELKIDDQIAVIGSPDDTGQIEAKLIRILPRIPQ